MAIPTLVIDSSKCLTDLCIIGANCRTDKSPLNQVGHRHPYTPVYSLLLSGFRYQNIKFAEIGVASGASVLMWNMFFEKGRFFFYDRDQNFLDHAKRIVPTQNNTFGIMDVRNPESIKECLESACVDGKLDVLLDDSSHNVNDQKIIIHESLPYIKSGGMIIIEDVSRDETNDNYFKIIEDIYNEFSFISFIVTEHENRYSPGWNNDKLLVLIKK
jgi:predicted O-methyltransferase YrrM